MNSNIFLVLYCIEKTIGQYELDTVENSNRAQAQDRERNIRQKLMNKGWDKKDLDTMIIPFSGEEIKSIRSRKY